MNNNMAKILEYVWGIVTLAVLVAAAYNTFTRGAGESLILYLCLVISAAMFMLRRNMNRNKNTGA